MKVMCPKCKGGTKLIASKSGGIKVCSCGGKGWIIKRKVGRPRKPTRPYWKDVLLIGQAIILWLGISGLFYTLF